MGVRGGASMRMGAAPPSSAPKSLLAASGESESESDLPRFDGPRRRTIPFSHFVGLETIR
jgi:hypothetical protein